ncbi:MAG TPA: SGNH/GDSL hydrolase family protein [Sedimentisphaerales bacterium]|jgi:lysophospholipase L1-like esterase|nr:SGNH/GDSL hydrolase family protein [Sedimentisphaerales bacterium]HNU30410.1 SGNH/GDSL hydrolase family protein [Sedimentisphaerales bacterium]
MKKHMAFLIVVAALVAPLWAQQLEPLPSDPYFATYKLLKAPPAQSLLKPGDRLAICGDSITEQKMYSRIIETYLTVCVPQLGVTVRQFGWSGERTPGFLARMENDVLRFEPTIATTCYGMNDHGYQPYQEQLGNVYRASSTDVIRLFKQHGVRVIQGSPGTVGKMPAWVKQAQGEVEDLNHSLAQFRNIGLGIATQEQVAFADVFRPMLVGGFEGKQRYGQDYMIAGKDGVHPGWAGQLVMAYAFLDAMGLDGNIGTITVNLADNKATASEGHRILSSQAGQIEIESSRYPFCAAGPANDDGSIRSGMTLVPFNAELNRFLLVVPNAPAGNYRVTWGKTTRTYTAGNLAEGVNLAADFETNPFSEAFQRVDDAVAKKQAYETRQIKELFHGPEGRADMTMTAALTEKARTPLADAIAKAFTPVRHTIVIKSEP